MLALTLGVLVDLMALIALPIYQANFEARDQVVINRGAVKSNQPGSLDEEDVEIKPIVERIDHQKINGGLTVIGIYVLLSIYLMSPPVKKYFIRQTALASVPLG
jgi:hypothetical protein